MGSVPILSINTSFTTDTMSTFDANFDVDAKCEWTLSKERTGVLKSLMKFVWLAGKMLRNAYG